MAESLELTGDPWLAFVDRLRAIDAPELQLFGAILKDACECLQPGAAVDRRTRAETRAWVLGTVASMPLCSFSEVCGALGLDGDAVRAMLLRHESW